MLVSFGSNLFILETTFENTDGLSLRFQSTPKAPTSTSSCGHSGELQTQRS